MPKWEVIFGYEQTGEIDVCVIHGLKPEPVGDGKLRLGAATVEFSGPVISIEEEVE
jgi:hypothetical protein